MRTLRVRNNRVRVAPWHQWFFNAPSSGYSNHSFRSSTMNTRIVSVLVSWAVLVFSSSARIAAQQPAPQPFTLDDEMKMRAIVDVRISPNGERVAYVLSTPSLAKNEHEGALFVVPSRGGESKRLGEAVHIFNTPVPRPQLRWAPDSLSVSLVGLVGSLPQIFSIPISGAAPRTLTLAPEGVFGHEWSPDGKSLAYLTRDSMTPDEARRRQDKSFVIRADAPDPATRLVVLSLDGCAPRDLTAAAHNVAGFSW